MLVPERECGECVACCQFMGIKHERLEKPTNKLCPYCVPSKGCSVYEDRPSPCSGWYCGWRMLGQLPQDWRPDLSGVVIWPQTDTPEEASVIILDKSKIFLTQEFATVIAAWASSGINVSFCRAGPVGFLRASISINEYVSTALEHKDLAAVLKIFLDMVKHMDTKHKWEPDGLLTKLEIKGA